MIDPGRIRSLKSGVFSGNAVLYWMIRDKRVSDNWALIVAQQTAIKNKVPLIVCFQYIGKFPESNIRQNGFLFKGLIETQKELKSLNIEFLFLQGKPEKIITDTINKRSIGTIIVDHNPLKVYRKRIKTEFIDNQKINYDLLQARTFIRKPRISTHNFFKPELFNSYLTP